MNNTVWVKQNARKQIDAADKKLFSLLARFNRSAQSGSTTLTNQERNDLNIPGNVEMWKNNAPRNLLRLVTSHLDLSDSDVKKTRQSIREIAAALSERFHALEGVAESKKADGEKDSFDEKRHKLVIQRGAQGVADAGGDYELGGLVFKTIADEFVRVQNEYLQEGSGPIADYLKAKSISEASRRPGW